MNVGATSETDYGDYFMWGSTTPNTNTPCNWANAPFNGESSDYDETKFNPVKGTVCPNGVLAKKYDAASHNMGGDWRMPTDAEFQELFGNTNNEWTQVNSVNGWKFTSKTDTSKYIFIPAAGWRTDSSFEKQGNSGYVWSSSLRTSHPGGALELDFNSGNCYVLNLSRCYGLSVRGVL